MSRAARRASGGAEPRHSILVHYTGIEHLRDVQGAKPLILVTEAGVMPPSDVKVVVCGDHASDRLGSAVLTMQQPRLPAPLTTPGAMIGAETTRATSVVALADLP